MATAFERLIRFEDLDGKIHYGEAGSDWQKDLVGQIVPTYAISNALAGEYSLSGEKAEISKVDRSSSWSRILHRITSSSRCSVHSFPCQSSLA